MRIRDQRNQFWCLCGSAWLCSILACSPGCTSICSGLDLCDSTCSIGFYFNPDTTKCEGKVPSCWMHFTLCIIMNTGFHCIYRGSNVVGRLVLRNKIWWRWQWFARHLRHCNCYDLLRSFQSLIITQLRCSWQYSLDLAVHSIFIQRRIHFLNLTPYNACT